MRVVSLLPAASEIVAALGCAGSLVGVSHECDFPPEIATRPRVTRCPIHGNALPSDRTDAWVKARLADAASLYTIDEDALRTLRPDLILTQGLCDVCAPALTDVRAVAARLPGPPQVLNLEPQTLSDIFDNVRTCAQALGVPDRGDDVVAGLSARVDRVRGETAALPRRRCVVLEWIAPPFANGHWGPEITELAGGIDPIGRKGADAVQVPWDDVVAAAPEVLVLACCGYDVARTLQDVPLLRACPGFDALPAVRSGRVFAVDGAAYFSRPGPRIVDSLEMLAEMIHPERFGGRFPDRGIHRVAL